MFAHCSYTFEMSADFALFLLYLLQRQRLGAPFFARRKTQNLGREVQMKSTYDIKIKRATLRFVGRYANNRITMQRYSASRFRQKYCTVKYIFV